MCKPSALAVVEVQSPAIRGNPEIIILVGRNPHHMVIAKRIRLVVYFTVIGKAVGTGMDNAQPFVMHTHPEVPFFVLKQIMYLRVAHLLHKLIEHRMRRDRLLIRSETHHPQSVGPRPDSTLFILHGTESPPGRTPAERLRIGNKPLLFLIVHRHPHTDGGDQHIAVLLFEQIEYNIALQVTAGHAVIGETLFYRVVYRQAVILRSEPQITIRILVDSPDMAAA